MTKFIKTAKELILKPEVFFQNLKAHKTNWTFPLAIYFIYIVFNSLFLNYKPLDFPTEMEMFKITTNPGFLFYLGIQAFWGTILLAISTAFVVLLIRLFYRTNFPIGAVSCLLPLLASLYILKTFDGIFAKYALLAIFTGMAILAAIKMKNNFIFLLKAIFAINLIFLMFMPPDSLAVFLKSENLFLAAQIAAAVWTILLFVKAAKTIEDISILKIIAIYGFAMITTAGMFYILFRTNLISDKVFKALLLT